MKITNGFLAAIGVLMMAAMPTWGTRVDRAVSSQGAFPPSNNQSDCVPSLNDPSFLVFGPSGAPCLVIMPDSSASINQFSAFQFWEGGHPSGTFIYEIPDFSNDASVTFTFSFDPTDSASPAFGSFLDDGVQGAALNFMVNRANAANLPGSAGPGDTYTFYFPAGTSTGNPQNPSNWYFAIDGAGSVKKISVATPEPGELVLLFVGIFGIGLMALRRHQESN
jgi:hypothetical protein